METVQVPRTLASRGRMALFLALHALFVAFWVWLYLDGGGRYDLAMACIFGLLLILRLRVWLLRPLVAEFSAEGLTSHGTVFSRFVKWDEMTWANIEDGRRAILIAHAPGGGKERYLAMSRAAWGERLGMLSEALTRCCPDLPMERPDPEAAKFD